MPPAEQSERGRNNGVMVAQDGGPEVVGEVVGDRTRQKGTSSASATGPGEKDPRVVAPVHAQDQQRRGSGPGSSRDPTAEPIGFQGDGIVDAGHQSSTVHHHGKAQGSARDFSPAARLAEYEKKFLGSLGKLSQPFIPEGGRQFFLLKIKRSARWSGAQAVGLPNPEQQNQDGSTTQVDQMAADIDDWCMEFLGAIKQDLSDLALEMNQHLKQSEVLALPMSVPDHAKLFLQHVMQAEVERAYANFERESGKDGLHIPSSDMRDVLSPKKVGCARM